MAINKLTITIIRDGKSSGGKSNGGDTVKSDKGKDSMLYKVLNLNDTVKSSVKQSMSQTEFYAVQSSVSLVKQIAKQSISYLVSDIGRKNGDSNYQAQVNRNMEIVSDNLSIAAAMLGGAATGASMGPAGALIGATVGAASAGISLGFKYAERERGYQHEQFKQNNNQSYNLARANYNIMTGRLR